MEASTHQNAPWQMTRAEVWETLCQSFRRALELGNVPVRIGDRIFIVNDARQVRQTDDVSIQILTEGKWISIPNESADELARTLQAIGPADHYFEVRRAISEEYPVPKATMDDYKIMTGLDGRASKRSRHKQPTRCIDLDGRLMERKFDRPDVGDILYYRLHACMVNLTIYEILTYRIYDGLWKVGVSENDEAFFAQRVDGPDGERDHWSSK